MCGRNVPIERERSAAGQREGKARATKTKRNTKKQTTAAAAARLPSRVYIPSTCSPKGPFGQEAWFNPMRIRSARTEDRIHGVRRGSCTPRDWD